MTRPLCFILMPFDKKPDTDGRVIDFDRVYREVIHPAVEEAGLEPLRADEEKTGGIIHTAMYERLILCEFAVADLTSANAVALVRESWEPKTTAKNLRFIREARQRRGEAFQWISDIEQALLESGK